MTSVILFEINLHIHLKQNTVFSFIVPMNIVLGTYNMTSVGQWKSIANDKRADNHEATDQYSF